MKTAAEILPIIGASARDLENWIERLELATSFAPSKQGRARVYSRANAIELAFLAAFVKAGVQPRTAAAFAAMAVRHDRFGPHREWIIFKAGDASKSIGTDKIDPSKLEQMVGEAAPASLALIAAGEIIRRIDRLYVG